MLDLLKTTLSSFCSPVEATSRAMEGVQAACAWQGVGVGAAGEQRAPCLWGRGQSRLDGSKKDSLLAWVVDSRAGTHLMLGCSWAILLSLDPWGPAAGPILQEALQPPKLHPTPSLDSLSSRQAPSETRLRKVPREFIASLPGSQRHWALSIFQGTGCLQRTRRTTKLTANCTWPKTGTPKLRYRRPPRVGPRVRVSGCTEAQRPSMAPAAGGGRVKSGLAGP